jgi:D-arabinose 1-dehydrogenase-like Zn-dependent alcohol dehydrogenase
VLTWVVDHPAPLLCAGIIGYRSLLRALGAGGTLAVAGIWPSDIAALRDLAHGRFGGAAVLHT